MCSSGRWRTRWRSGRSEGRTSLRGLAARRGRVACPGPSRSACPRARVGVRRQRPLCARGDSGGWHVQPRGGCYLTRGTDAPDVPVVLQCAALIQIALAAVAAGDFAAALEVCTRGEFQLGLRALTVGGRHCLMRRTPPRSRRAHHCGLRSPVPQRCMHTRSAAPRTPRCTASWRSGHGWSVACQTVADAWMRRARSQTCSWLQRRLRRWQHCIVSPTPMRPLTYGAPVCVSGGCVV
jgi:hypothetical protein